MATTVTPANLKSEYVDGPVASLLFALIGATSMFRDLQVGSIHVANIAIVLCFICTFRRGSTLSTCTREVAFLVFGVALLALSMIGSTQYVNGLLWVQLVIQCASAILLVSLLNTRRLGFVLIGMVASASASSLLAIGQQLRLVPGELFEDSSGLLRPTGLVGEPDWVGLFAALALVVLMRWRTDRAVVRFVLVAINLCALVFSFARAAWLALLLSIAVAWLITRLRGRPSILDFRLSGKVVVFLAAAVVAVVILFPDLAETARVRALSIVFDEHRDDNALYRGRQLDALVSYAQSAPWHGYGLSASARVTILGEVQLSGHVSAQNAVATNWVLGLLADAKILAIPFILLVLVLAVTRANTLGGQLMIVVAVNSLFSNIMYVPSWWVPLAILIAASKLGGLRGRPAAGPVRDQQLRRNGQPA